MRVLNCPRCAQPMTTQTVVASGASVVVDVCETSCGGIWLDEGDMRAGLDVTDDLQMVSVQPSYVPDTSQPAPCPVCETTMQRYRWNYTSPVYLDQCPDGHGAWVDAGEVQAMEKFEEHEVLETTQRVKIQARLGMDRLELETAHQKTPLVSQSPAVRLLELLMRPFE